MAQPTQQIPEDVQALIDEFSMLDDWEDRYRHVIALGDAMARLPAEDQVEANRVRGCTSQVWLTATPTSDSPRRFIIAADSDAHIVRGLAAILVRIYSGRTAEEILALDAEAVLAKLGLDSHLSPQRSNGLRSMVERIRALAAASQGVSAGRP
jgi:cysteine desulfuration protein SufE